MHAKREHSAELIGPVSCSTFCGVDYLCGVGVSDVLPHRCGQHHGALYLSIVCHECTCLICVAVLKAIRARKGRGHERESAS